MFSPNMETYHFRKATSLSLNICICLCRSVAPYLRLFSLILLRSSFMVWGEFEYTFLSFALVYVAACSLLKHVSLYLSHMLVSSFLMSSLNLSILCWLLDAPNLSSWMSWWLILSTLSISLVICSENFLLWTQSSWNLVWSGSVTGGNSLINSLSVWVQTS